jgi:hypothetical protein
VDAEDGRTARGWVVCFYDVFMFGVSDILVGLAFLDTFLEKVVGVEWYD